MSATAGSSLTVDRTAPTQPTAGVRLCIVSFEVNGPCRNGGIGTAYSTLAVKLARAGHDVTLLSARGRHCEQLHLDYWIAHYHRQGVKLTPLPGADPVLADGDFSHLSHLVYRWLARQGDFDLVHFHEWLGLGYFSLLARRLGLALTRTTCCVGLHSPSRWIEEANQQQPAECLGERDLQERRSAELADVVWSPSRYLLDWVADQGWRVGATAFVRPNPLPDGRPGIAPQPLRELVFFGRLEPRKGLFLFCDALDRLNGQTDCRVTFLGKPTHRADVELRRRAAKWTFPVRLLTDCDQAEGLRYLQAGGRLAVMPSLSENCPLTVIECLGLGVPFVASAVGGIPELVARECHATHLVAPRVEPLAERLRRALQEGVAPARLAFDPVRLDQDWDEWHRQFHREPARPPVADLESLQCLVQAQERRIDWLERQLSTYAGERKYLRYRIADAVCAALRKVRGR